MSIAKAFHDTLKDSENRTALYAAEEAVRSARWWLGHYEAQADAAQGKVILAERALKKAEAALGELHKRRTSDGE